MEEEVGQSLSLEMPDIGAWRQIHLADDVEFQDRYAAGAGLLAGACSTRHAVEPLGAPAIIDADMPPARAQRASAASGTSPLQFTAPGLAIHHCRRTGSVERETARTSCPKRALRCEEKRGLSLLVRSPISADLCKRGCLAADGKQVLPEHRVGARHHKNGVQKCSLQA
jgi:hypothetical protein